MAFSSLTSQSSKASPFKAQLDKLYQSTAGRDVDPEGLDFYSNHLANGADWDTMQKNIVADFGRQGIGPSAVKPAASSFSSYVAPPAPTPVQNSWQAPPNDFRVNLDNAFISSFNRPAGAGEVNFYQDKINNDNWTQNDINTYVAEDARLEQTMAGHDAMSNWGTAERNQWKQGQLQGLNLERTGTPQAQQQQQAPATPDINQYRDQFEELYQNTWKRPVDDAGFEFFANNLAAGNTTWDNIVNNVTEAARVGLNPNLKMSDSDWRDTASELYQETFGRRPDGEGSDFWRNSGKSIDEIRDIFMNSDERYALEDDYEDFYGSANNALQDYLQAASGLGAADTAQADQLKFLLADMQNQLRGYDNPILDQLGGFDSIYGQINDTLNPAIENVYALNNAETQKISGFEQKIIQQAQQVRNQLQELDPWDKAGAQALRAQLQDLESQAYGFQSELDFDFSDEFVMAGSADSAINSFLANYNSMDASRRTNLDNLSRTIMTGGIQDATSFDLWDTKLNELARGDDISAQQQALQALRDRREQKMNGFSTRLSDLGSGIDAIELSDITGLDTRRNRLREVEDQLTGYRGGRAPDLQDQLDQYMQAIEGRYDQRSSRRNEINSMAETLLGTVQDGAYRSVDDLDPIREQMASLRGDVNNFDVFNAEDELAKLAELLSGHQSRLEQDQQNASMYGTGVGTGGGMNSGNVRYVMPGTMSGMGAGYLNDQQIMAMMRAAEDEKMSRNTYNPGTFAQNVIRVRA